MHPERQLRHRAHRGFGDPLPDAAPLVQPARGFGGAGRNRGGLGCIREIEIRTPELRVSAFVERNVIKPEGLFDGKEGTNSALLVKVGGSKEFQTMKQAFGTHCNAKFSDVYMHAGDVIRLVTSGGGGYGDPAERDWSRIESDVREGYFSREQAEREYRVVFTLAGAVDPEATRALRAG